ncbi:MAG: GHKL domain-containing protein [Lachnospiraceae bacterium]|nr:GHKL domain-containing protein [Lachnospiraceae bacterium]
MADYMDFFNRDIMGSVQVLTGCYYFTKLLQKKSKPYVYVLFVIAWLAVTKMIPSGRITEFLVFTALLVTSGILICRADLKSAVLYAALTVEVMQLSYGIVNDLIGILYPHMFSFDQKIVGIVFAVFGNIALLLAVFCYRAICRCFSYYEMIEKKYVLTVLIPILMIFLMGEYINYSMMYELHFADNTGMFDYRNHYLMFVIQLFGMASLFCIMSAYKKLLQNFRLRTELSLLEQEEHSLNRYVEEAKAHYEETKSFRHDIKNHLTVVKELLQSGKTGQALCYITDMEGMTGGMSFPCATNNPVVDILIGNKLGMAKGMGMEVSCPLILPYPCPVRDIDLCIILSNALDNAIHACRNTDDGVEKYIRVSGHMQGDFMLLEIENSFEGKGLIRQGTGLSNIKAVAEKYQGTMRVKTQGTVFTLNVLLITTAHS